TLVAQQGASEQDADDARPAARQLHGAARLVEAGLPPAPEGTPARVLFLGNSLTYTSGMPQMLVGLARTAGINLVTEQHTPGGYSLEQQDSTPKVQALLAQGGWNYVVLQDQSAMPSDNDDYVRAHMDPA